MPLVGDDRRKSIAGMGTSLGDQAYELIRGDIITCVLEPGIQLFQPQLVQRYGVGITPVREALKRLSHDGLVESVPRIGYIVSQITFSDLFEMFELRLILELNGVRLAVERASDEQLETISKNASFTYTHGNKLSYSEYLAHNTEFHCSITETAGNQRLTAILSRTLDELTRVFHLGLDLRDSADEKLQIHCELADALRRRDSDEAQSQMRHDIERSRERVLEAVQSHAGYNVTLARR